MQVRPFARNSTRSITLGYAYEKNISLAATNYSSVSAGLEGVYSGSQHPQAGGLCSRREQAGHDWPCSRLRWELLSRITASHTRTF